ncbi:type VI secretion system baseplate subunit TssG [Tautonia marina]|uniref:type VI secretion system baseplate subunit TssG n=1 Tax=Tautonia marina TaxID=2653855 RepID=UPI001260A319|nr:type VI secretion system baseplate subunit TssG [Tautonia marina]
MGTAQRRSNSSVSDRLFADPTPFDFFQAARLLEQLGAASGRLPVGHDGPPSREAVRFLAHLSLSFPPSAITGIDGRPSLPLGTSPESTDESPEPPEIGAPPKMTTAFLGLVGPLGALPTVYTEALVGPDRRRRAAAAMFFDLFHHRIVSLFYRIRQKYQIPVLWEASRNAGGARADRFARHLFDLIGLGSPSLQNRLAVEDEALLFYSGIFAQQHRPAVMLERLLKDYFGVPARIQSFSGQWLRLDPDQRTRLGRRGAQNGLGTEAIAGRKIWDDQSKFRVLLGPMGILRFGEFLPGGRASLALMELIRLFVGPELDFDVRLILIAEEVPPCRLSLDRSQAAQLGRTSWLSRRPDRPDADDAVLRPPPKA